MLRCAAICALVALAAAAPAQADVAVVVRPAVPLEQYARAGAVGLLVPGAGSTVTREGALAALVRGEVRNALVGGTPTGQALIRPAARPGTTTIYVQLPPAGRTHNVRRYPIAVVGPGWHGLLTSRSTRIPGLVSIADVAPAAVALAHGKRSALGSRLAADAPAQLRELDARLAAAHDARAPARVTVVCLLFAFFVVSWLLGSRALARAGLLVGPAVLLAALALSAAHEARVPVVVAAFLAAAAVGGAIAALGDRAAAWAVVAALVVEIVVLAAWPATNALAALGPHPDGGGRYYGITNEMETLLLAATLFASVVLGPLAGLPALLLVGWSRAGADGGGLLVFAAALGVLWFLRSGRRMTLRAATAGVALVVAAALALVGIDAATGGSSHVTHAVSSGPGGWWRDATHRWRVSWAGATKTWAIVLQSLSGLIALVVFTVTRRGPAIMALAVGVAVSVVVNDTPQDVLAFGALTGASLWVWERTGNRP